MLEKSVQLRITLYVLLGLVVVGTVVYLSVKHWRAMTAIEALGPAAVPRLLDLANDPKTAQQARDALFQIGENGVSPLVAALTNMNSEVRMNAATALGWLGSEGQAALPALRKTLEDREWRVRGAATNAFKQIDLGAAARPEVE